MDTQKGKMMMEMQRHDSDIPLQRLTLPRLNLQERFKDELALPDQFLRTCTLREGVWIVVLTLNAVAAGLVAFLMWLLMCYPEETDYWWHHIFLNDFDYYFMDENLHLVNFFYPLWRPITYAVIVTKIIYFATGLVVLLALCCKSRAPLCMYMPWLIMTGFLVGVMWLMAFLMIIYTFALFFYRDVTVTWDVGPICCVILYAIWWSYAFFVVVAHYKRRCIVKYWMGRKKATGSDTVGPEY